MVGKLNEDWRDEVSGDKPGARLDGKMNEKGGA